MRDEQILIKVFEKAVKNGWTYYYFQTSKANPDISFLIKEWIRKYIGRYFTLIFLHSFAKSFFGGNDIDNFIVSNTVNNKEHTICLHKWEYHLQQMVLKKNPLKYLEKFLEK